MNFLQVYNDIKENGGSAYNFFTGSIPESGYIVAFKQFELITKTYNVFSLFKLYLSNFLNQRGIFSFLEIDNNYIGFWIENEILYINVVTKVDTLRDARELAISNNEISFWDVKNKQVIYTKQKYNEKNNH